MLHLTYARPKPNTLINLIGIQRAGDLVLTSGATLHWVRSLGFSTHFSWNFGLLDREQFAVSMERYRINDEFTIQRNVIAAESE